METATSASIDDGCVTATMTAVISLTKRRRSVLTSPAPQVNFDEAVKATELTSREKRFLCILLQCTLRIFERSGVLYRTTVFSITELYVLCQVTDYLG